jgi:hypothetical protein
VATTVFSDVILEQHFEIPDYTVSHHRTQYSRVHRNITSFWNVTPSNLMFTDVSEVRTASIFKAEESQNLLL